MPLSATISTGLVKGRFGDRVVAGPNGEKLLIPARGRIDFVGMTPFSSFPLATPDPITMLRPTGSGILDSDGYLCTPDPDDKDKPGERMVLLQADNDPDSTVQGWTWRATLRFVNADGTRVHNTLNTITFDLPFGDVPFDLAHAVDVPESVGIGTEQAIILAAAAQAHAASADAAAEAAAADAKVAREGVAEVVGALPSKADLIDGKVPVEQLPPAVGVTDEVVAPLVDMPETAAKIDARVAGQVAGKLDADTADATFQTKTDAEQTAEALTAAVAEAKATVDEVAAEGKAVAESMAPIAESVQISRDLGPHLDLFPYHVALSQAATSRVDVAFLGDSLWEGVNATQASAVMWRQLRDILNARYAPGANPGEVFLPPRNVSALVPAPDEKWTITGSAWAQGVGPKGTAVQMQPSSVASGTFTATKVRLFFMNMFGTAMEVDITIDDKTVRHVVPNTPKWNVWESATLAIGAHSVKVAQAVGQPFFVGAEFVRDTKGVHVWNLSVSGMSADTRANASDASDWANWIGRAYTPSLIVIPLLGNDAPTSTATVYKSNIQKIITAARARTSAPILLIPNWGPGVRVHLDPWDSYLQVLRELASANTGVEFHNLNRVVPDLTAADPAGIGLGLPHLNHKGQKFQATITAEALSLPR